jgi:hypothetical protein
MRTIIFGDAARICKDSYYGGSEFHQQATWLAVFRSRRRLPRHLSAAQSIVIARLK